MQVEGGWWRVCLNGYYFKIDWKKCSSENASWTWTFSFRTFGVFCLDYNAAKKHVTF